MSEGQPGGLRSLRGRAGTEQEMSFNRLLFAGIFALYLGLLGGPATRLGLINLAFWSTLGLGVFLHIRRHPGPTPIRRGFALVLDMGCLSWFLHIGAEYAAPFFLVYVWVALGNGFRFGAAWLVASMVAFVIGFGLVALTTPFWRGIPHLAVGLLVGPLVLSLYAATLIRKLSEARRLAEQASDAKSNFLARVSHELRTPLNAIIGMGSLLRDTRLDAEQQEMSRTITTAARALLGMINGILDFARIEAGAVINRPEQFALPALLREVRGLVAAQARAKGLRVHLHVTPRTPLRIECDRGHLRDILLNLAGNAVKFTAAGGVDIALDAARRADGKLVLLAEVADSGPGVPEAARATIFDRFTQAHEEVGGSRGGTGLGLAICSGLVSIMGGEISLECPADGGSIFRFTALVAPGAATTRADLAGLRLHLRSAAGADPGPLADLVRSLGAEVTPEPLSASEAADPGLRHVLLSDDAEAARFGPQEARLELRLGHGAGLPALPLRRRCLAVLPALPPRELLLESLATLRDLGAAAATRDAEARPRDHQPGASLRLLVADDNRVNRQVMQRILQREGHEVVLAVNGEEALDLLDSGGFDLVLMDVNMPELDGVEATKLYRVAALGQPHVPIIGVTADATPRAAARCLAAGMDACLTKPFEPAELVELVAAHAIAPQARATPRQQFVKATADDATAGNPTGAALDTAVLARLAALGGEDFSADLVRDFLADAEPMRRRLEEAAHRQDPAAFRTAAHALRSSAANLGALGVTELCRRAEALRPDQLAALGPHHAAMLAVELRRVAAAAPAPPP